MLPVSKTDPTEWKNYKVFHDNQYPASTNCNVVKQQLIGINEDIATLNWLRLSLANRKDYKGEVKSQFVNNLNYLHLLKQSKDAFVASNCSSSSNSSTNSTSPTVNNATIPNTTVKNETPKTDVLPSTTPSPTVNNATVPNDNVIEENKTGFAQYATPQNGAIVLGAIILLVAVYFATKKKTTTSKTN